MAIVLLDVFKALEVKSQDCWKLLNSHPLVSLLVRAASVALELVVRAQGLRRREVPIEKVVTKWL